MLTIEEKFPLSRERNLVYKNCLTEIGNTPLHEFTEIPIAGNNRIFGKLEYQNPTGSHHIRIYPTLFRILESKKLIYPGITPIVETSIGNAGAAMVYCANRLGFNKPSPKIIVPADASKARIKQIAELGGDLIFSPAGRYSEGYVEVLTRMLDEDKKNKGNFGEDPTRLVAISKVIPEAKMAYEIFVKETVNQLRNIKLNNIDYFFGAVGSGTSLSGIGKYVKQAWPKSKVVAIEPQEAPVARYLRDNGKPLTAKTIPHKVHGVGTYGIPKGKLNIDFNVIDQYETFSNDDWVKTLSIVKEQEGLPIGPSTAAVMSVALKHASKFKDKSILICCYDNDWKAV
ncbi:pyridoxal-phosphate dependent enzyme [Ekhidna sp.]|uniref:pyridoxal-phosphate dependent enzyme n=2 Tax=Ekhidna sp. TaxID=2608089 RepID=UPI00329946B1